MTSPPSIAQYERENIILKEQIEKKTGKTTEQLDKVCHVVRSQDF